MSENYSRRPWIVRECLEPNDFTRLSRFRYTQCVEPIGAVGSVADHENRIVVDAFDAFGTNIVAESAGTVVGSVRINRCYPFMPTDAAALRQDEDGIHHCLVSPSLVHPDWRQTAMFVDLAVAAADRIGDKAWRSGLVIDIPVGEEERCLAAYASLGFAVRRRDPEAATAGYGNAVRFHLGGAADEGDSFCRNQDAKPGAAPFSRLH